MPTKYEILQESLVKLDDSFQRYEDECREFISEFRKGLASHLECPDNRIFWAWYSDEFIEDKKSEENFILATPDRYMLLYSDSFYSSTFVIILSPDNVSPQRGVHLNFRVKKQWNSYVLKFETDSREYVIREGGWEEMVKALEYVYIWAKELLETDAVNFIQRKKKSIGFVVNK